MRYRSEHRRFDQDHVALVNARLRETKAVWASFMHVDMCGADLTGADLRYAHFEDANLEGALLCSARLEGAYLKHVRLIGTVLCGATGLESVWAQGVDVDVEGKVVRLAGEELRHWLLRAGGGGTAETARL
jgi:hypothetical protein